MGDVAAGSTVSSPFLRLAGIGKAYRDRAALIDVSIDISAGESLVILGPSGCGKTTLLRVVAGLTRPDAGEVCLDGQVVSSTRTFVPPHLRRLGFVFQDLALWPHLTVCENLEFVLRAGKRPKRERESRAQQTLRLVQVEQLSASYPHELSGGEQQRVALARALVGEARLLLLDEPLSSLDAELRQTLRIELRRLQRDLRLTTVYVTHDRDDAAVLADRVIEMCAGRIVSAAAAPITQETS
jgi:iron(III) transport system ATP-binding protein